MANIYEFLNTTGCLPTIARFLIVLCSISIELAQTFVVIATNYMHDPSDCLLHKERVVLSGEQAVSLETLPDRFNAWSSTYRGTYRGQCVAVKVWRGEGLSIPSKERTDFFRKLEREIIGWQAISHTNIATVYGLAFTFANLPSLVTNYYPNGNINDYLSKNPTAEKNKLLIGVASGLQYLHQLNPPVSHGDVRGSNIFIADNGDPVLCDLGLSQLPTPPDWTIPSDDGTRWMAPEVMDPRSSYSNSGALESFTAPMSDVYSFGMTVMEIHTGNIPFHTRRFYGGVVLDVMRGIRPMRPSVDSCPTLTDELWHLIQSCWSQDPLNRPTIKLVRLWLQLIDGLRIGRLSSSRSI